MRVTKTDQLRVRLKPVERKQLERYIDRRGGKETISDVVREALDWCLSPESDKQPVHVKTETMQQLEELAAKLHRNPEQIIHDAITALRRAVEGKPMLIVEELKLRAQYTAAA